MKLLKGFTTRAVLRDVQISIFVCPGPGLDVRTVGPGGGRREKSCFEVEVIYSRRQPSSGVSGVDAALGWGDLWRGQEGETGDETAAADILYTLVLVCWKICRHQNKRPTISSFCEYRDECGSQETIVGRETKLFVTRRGNGTKLLSPVTLRNKSQFATFPGKS